MKRLIIIISMIFILISCQQNIVPDYTKIPAEEVLTRSLSTEKVGPDDPIVFLPATNMKAWTNIGPLEERFATCKVPSTRLASMTTEALVKSMMNYPLNYLVFVYNDPQMAINLIIENSPLHQEFLSRQDAAEVFVDMYARVEMDMRIEKGNYDGDYTSLSYTNTMFMDYFVGSDVLMGLDKVTIRQKLADAVSRKLLSRLQDTERFSMFSIEPLLAIDETESLGIASFETRAHVTSTVTVYTPWGQPITAFTMSSTSSTEAAQMENQARLEYPSAIVRGPATWSYNCHSYAWHNSSTENDVWINSYLSDPSDLQLEKYWENDLYIESAVLTPDVEKVFYSNGDHSAILLPNGNYQSKWGAWPLMEHALHDCPYNSTQIQYFKKRPDQYIYLTISGQTPVVTHQNYTYNASVPAGCANIDLEWEVRFMDAPSPTPFNLIVSPNGRSASLTCQDYGLFKIVVKGYRNDKLMALGQLGVISMPAM